MVIQDWKAHCGWNKLSKQRGDKGSERGLILSLLCDHLLLLHPEQSCRLNHNQPGLPVGCLIERLKAESLIDSIKDLISANDPKQALAEFTHALKDCVPTRDSSKHMVGKDLGRQEASETLKYRAAA